jgi:small-conductance mechanosensitive channel
VTKINFLFTTIKTPDNKRITIPNSSIVNKCVVDYDSNKTRRVELKFEAAYESDVEKVKEIVLNCFKSNGKILLNPAPTCRLNGLKSSGIEFVCRCWCDKEDYWDVYFDMTELIFNELKKNKISIPYTQLEIRQRTDEVVLPYNNADLPERVEKQREEQIDYDLENIDIKKVIRHRKQQKAKKQANKSKESKTKSSKKEEKK